MPLHFSCLEWGQNSSIEAERWQNVGVDTLQIRCDRLHSIGSSLKTGMQFLFGHCADLRVSTDIEQIIK